MRLHVLLVLAALATAGCACKDDRASGRLRGQQDATYRTLSDAYLRGYFRMNPESAVSAGLHEYDGRVGPSDRVADELEHSANLKALDTFSAMDPLLLSEPVDFSRRVLINEIQKQIFSHDVRRSRYRNPMSYTGFVDPNIYIKRNYAPLSQRLAAINRSLAEMPRVLNDARLNLEEVLPRTFVEAAIQNGEGAAEFIEQDLPVAVAGAEDPAALDQFKRVSAIAARSMRDYVEWLKSERLPTADDNFAIGREAFVRMLRDAEMINESPDAILERATALLAEQQQQFNDAAARIDPNRPALEVFADIKKDHPTARSLLPETRKHLDDIHAFVVARRIITIPTDVRVKVEETPKSQRFGSFASMDTPGPFEKTATEAYYYVTPVEPEWDEKRADEWLTSFNYWTTDVVSIHEAYPGHYVQFLRVNASSVDCVQKVFGSYAFSEGWAHYSEQMMLEEGFGKEQGELAHAKYQLAQADEALLRICRLICAIRIHTQGMTVDQATQFFMDNCHYERATAKAEAERGTFDPGYGFYTLGKRQMLKLRDDWKRQEGPGFSLLRFHDEVTNHGAPPIRMLREKMLKDPKIWDQSL